MTQDTIMTNNQATTDAGELAAVEECDREREWTKWSDQRPPNAPGEYRYRATFDLLGVRVTPEWTEKMHLCGMGHGDSEWWPLSPCYWDGYKRYITITNLEWAPVLACDPEGVVWNGLDLLPCPFTGKQPKVEAQGQFIGAPLWRTEALWISSPAVPKRRWTNAKAMVESWNTRPKETPTEQGEVARELAALPVQTLITNIDEGTTGPQSVRVPLELRDRILASLSHPVSTELQVAERIAQFVEQWNGDTRDGDTVHIAMEIREQFGSAHLGGAASDQGVGR